MKRIGWVIAVGGAVIVTWALWNGQAPVPSATAETAAQSTAPAASATPVAPKAEKIIFTFEDQAKMDDFTKLWDSRRAVILRMTVLQSYWNEEQATLAQLNQKLETDYKMNFNKDYYLDRERRAIVERETQPAPVPSPPAEAKP